ncbi:MarR family transcriptional regulator [Streptomyces sp. NPDC093707]|uniref:MarR family transcriptional regulator n=1 Tax=Streptomyces sp. NPDC093707 TaxID=3154984 RepID=UPI00344E7185
MSNPTPDTAPAHNGPFTGLTGAAATVYTELLGHTEPVTVAALADAAGLGHSTAGRAVAALEKRGLAHRTAGGHDGPRRMPDRWQAATSSPAPDTANTPCIDGHPPRDQEETTPDDAAQDNTDGSAEPCQAPQRGSTPNDPAPPSGESADSNKENEAHALQAISDDPMPEPSEPSEPSEPMEPMERTSGNEGDNDRNSNSPESEHSTEGHSATPRDTEPTATPSTTQTGRLVPGALRQMVIDHLQAHPDEAFTATRISRIIERSSGAIANALAKLATADIVEQVTHQPRTYRLTRTTPATPTNHR